MYQSAAMRTNQYVSSSGLLDLLAETEICEIDNLDLDTRVFQSQVVAKGVKRSLTSSTITRCLFRSMKVSVVAVRFSSSSRYGRRNFAEGENRCRGEAGSDFARACLCRPIWGGRSFTGRPRKLVMESNRWSVSKNAPQPESRLGKDSTSMTSKAIVPRRINLAFPTCSIIQCLLPEHQGRIVLQECLQWMLEGERNA